MSLVAIFWKCKLYLQVLGHVLYAAVMLQKFYKITSLEKKMFYTGFQQATRLSFTGFSSRWKYRLGVSMGLPAHRLLVGVGVCQQSNCIQGTIHLNIRYDLYVVWVQTMYILGTTNTTCLFL